MAKFKKLATVAAAAILATAAITPAHALFGGAGGGAKEVTQVVSWAAQYIQMVREYNQLVEEYKSLNGVRGMANLVNNPEVRKYLPPEFETILKNGYGDWKSVLDAINNDGKKSSSDRYEQFKRQLAIDEATISESYRQASKRFEAIQVLLDKINDAPDAKDIQDLQARITAEQVMLQNEQNKLSMLVKLQEVQRQKKRQMSQDNAIRRAAKESITEW